MKKGWDKYATKKRYIKKGYLRKYRNGNPFWKTPETSGSDCIQQSGKIQEEKIEILDQSELSLCLKDIVDNEIDFFGRVVLVTGQVKLIGDENESVRKEDVSETHQEGRQGIQESDQGGYKTEKTNTCKTKREKMKKQSVKEKKHEAKETKAYEKKEDKKESKSKNK